VTEYVPGGTFQVVGSVSNTRAGFRYPSMGKQGIYRHFRKRRERYHRKAIYWGAKGEPTELALQREAVHSTGKSFYRRSEQLNLPLMLPVQRA
jgi:hypothetical protein